MRTVSYRVSYKAGGYPSPTYTGSRVIGINLLDDVDKETAIELASAKARREIASDMAMEPSQVSIVSIEQKAGAL